MHCVDSPQQKKQPYKSWLLSTIKQYYKQSIPSIYQMPNPSYLTQQQLKSFKTQICPDLHKHQYELIHNSFQKPYFFNCFYFHSDKDQRRVPYCQNNKKEPDQKQQKKGHQNEQNKRNFLAYQPVYLGDVGQPGYHGDACANWVEYMYHPYVYKTIQCIVPTCNQKYCPKVHKNQARNQNKLVQESEQSPEILKQIKKLKTLRDKSITDNLNQQLQKAAKNIFKNVSKIMRLQHQQSKKEEEIRNQISNLAALGLTGKDKQRDKNRNNSKYKNKQGEKEDKDKNQEKEKKYDSKSGQYDRLFFMEQLQIVQDRHHQFKMFKDKDPRRIAAMALEYISAFLNSDGGSIYFGINDQSIVHGLDVDQKWLDNFKLAIDCDGRQHLNPPLIPQKYDLKLIPVTHPKNHKKVVIQIKVFPQQQSEKKILTLYKKQCYLRMSASNHRLSAADIMQYMRLMSIKKQNKSTFQYLSSVQDKIDTLNMKQLKQMQQSIQGINVKVVNLLRKKQIGGVVITTAKREENSPQQSDTQN